MSLVTWTSRRVSAWQGLSLLVSFFTEIYGTRPQLLWVSVLPALSCHGHGHGHIVLALVIRRVRVLVVQDLA